jgi:glycerol uptake facilitator-like aquaporin
MTAALSRRLAAEAVGTAALLATVVGSGIMGDRLSQGNAAIALLANAIATGCALYVLISIFAPLSGAHFNPLITALEWRAGRLSFTDALAYVAMQCVAAMAGVALAHLMFDLPAWSLSEHARSGAAQCLSEFVATFGLVVVIRQGARNAVSVAALVACYITAAYWITSSTSFANPAVTLARALTDTFSGIRWVDALPFIVAQIGGACAAWLFLAWLDAHE